jgi:hypothetical protein
MGPFCMVLLVTHDRLHGLHYLPDKRRLTAVASRYWVIFSMAIGAERDSVV